MFAGRRHQPQSEAQAPGPRDVRFGCGQKRTCWRWGPETSVEGAVGRKQQSLARMYEMFRASILGVVKQLDKNGLILTNRRRSV